MNYYFLGIGGIGMSALARYFHLQGHQVSGYDRTPSPLTQQLEAEGIPVHYNDDPALIPEALDVLTGDVSFISLTKVLPPCAPLLRPEAWVFVLVKPQFEAERHEIGSGGVVRDEAVRRRCVEQIQRFAVEELRWTSCGDVPSPIKGPKGNQEYIAVFRA